MSNPTNNLEDILKNIEDLTGNLGTECVLPISKKKVFVKTLLSEQRNNIIATAIDQKNAIFLFWETLGDVIEKNLKSVSPEEDPVEFDNLTIFDRDFLALVLRSTVSDTVKLVSGENDDQPIEFSLDKILKNFQNIPQSTEIQIDGLSVQCEIPLIKIEKEYTQYYKKNIPQQNNSENIEKARLFLAEGISAEISKWVTEIKVKDSPFGYPELPLEQKIQICQKLPSKIGKSILDHILETKKKFENFASITKKSKTYRLEITPELFS